MAETREPDRFDKQAADLLFEIMSDGSGDEASAIQRIASALRATESEALERAAHAFEVRTQAGTFSIYAIARELRALKPDPAPAPAASAEEIRAAQRTAVYPADIEEAARMHAAYDAAAEAAAESEALERAAQIADRYKSGVAVLIADSIRDLIPPAAAPAACPRCDPRTPGRMWNARLGRSVPCADPSHTAAPAAETGTDPWVLLDQAREWLEFMVRHPGDGDPKNLIARIDAALAARATPQTGEGR